MWINRIVADHENCGKHLQSTGVGFGEWNGCVSTQEIEAHTICELNRVLDLSSGISAFRLRRIWAMLLVTWKGSV